MAAESKHILAEYSRLLLEGKMAEATQLRVENPHLDAEFSASARTRVFDIEYSGAERTYERKKEA